MSASKFVDRIGCSAEYFWQGNHGAIHPAELSSSASPARYCHFLAKIQIDSVPVNSTYEPGVRWGHPPPSRKGIGMGYHLRPSFLVGGLNPGSWSVLARAIPPLFQFEGQQVRCP